MPDIQPPHERLAAFICTLPQRLKIEIKAVFQFSQRNGYPFTFNDLYATVRCYDARHVRVQQLELFQGLFNDTTGNSREDAPSDEVSIFETSFETLLGNILRQQQSQGDSSPPRRHRHSHPSISTSTGARAKVSPARSVPCRSVSCNGTVTTVSTLTNTPGRADPNSSRKSRCNSSSATTNDGMEESSSNSSSVYSISGQRHSVQSTKASVNTEGNLSLEVNVGQAEELPVDSRAMMPLRPDHSLPSGDGNTASAATKGINNAADDST